LNNELLSFLSWYHPGDTTLVLYGLVPLVIGALALALKRVRLPSLGRMESALSTRAAVLIIGVISTITFRYEWGTFRALPLVHDEAAYILQARLFAAGKWTDSVPIPEFFEQPHVLVTPRFAAKYGPGNALLLTPGIWFDRPGLMPVIVLGVTGALIFVLGRRIVNVWVGVFAWMIWLGLASETSTFRPSYFSEILTEALWLSAWWALLRWRDDRRVGYLLLVAASIGWMVLTRPLTAVAFALPVGVAVLVLVWRTRAWAQLAAALAVGMTFLAVIPLWSAKTTRNWRVSPLVLYNEQYMPYEVLGFGLREKALLREAPPEIACFENSYGATHRWHVVAAIPGDLHARTHEAINAFFADRRRGLIVFAALGILASPVELGFMLGTCIALLLAYHLVRAQRGLDRLLSRDAAGVCAPGGRWSVGDARRDRASMGPGTARGFVAPARHASRRVVHVRARDPGDTGDARRCGTGAPRKVDRGSAPSPLSPGGGLTSREPKNRVRSLCGGRGMSAEPHSKRPAPGERPELDRQRPRSRGYPAGPCSAGSHSIFVRCADVDNATALN